MHVMVTVALDLQPFKVFSVLSWVSWTLGEKTTVFVHNSLQLFKANTKIGYMISACCSWVKIFLLLESRGNNTTFLLVYNFSFSHAHITKLSSCERRSRLTSNAAGWAEVHTSLTIRMHVRRIGAVCAASGTKVCVFLSVCVCMCSCKSVVLRTGVHF